MLTKIEMSQIAPVVVGEKRGNMTEGHKVCTVFAFLR